MKKVLVIAVSLLISTGVYSQTEDELNSFLSTFNSLITGYSASKAEVAALTATVAEKNTAIDGLVAEIVGLNEDLLVMESFKDDVLADNEGLEAEVAALTAAAGTGGGECSADIVKLQSDNTALRTLVGVGDCGNKMEEVYAQNIVLGRLLDASQDQITELKGMSQSNPAGDIQRLTGQLSTCRNEVEFKQEMLVRLYENGRTLADLGSRELPFQADVWSDLLTKHIIPDQNNEYPERERMCVGQGAKYAGSYLQVPE